MENETNNGTKYRRTASTIRVNNELWRNYKIRIVNYKTRTNKTMTEVFNTLSDIPCQRNINKFIEKIISTKKKKIYWQSSWCNSRCVFRTSWHLLVQCSWKGLKMEDGKKRRIIWKIVSNSGNKRTVEKICIES